MKLLSLLSLAILFLGEALYISGSEIKNIEPDVAVLNKVYKEKSASDKIIEKRSYDIGLWGLSGLGWPLYNHGWGNGLNFSPGILGGGWGGAGFGGTGFGWYRGWNPNLPLIHGSYGPQGWNYRR